MKIASTLVAVLALAGLPATFAAEPAKPPATVAAAATELLPRELNLIAPRDGHASGTVVVRGPKVAGVAVTPPRLTGPGGAVLPPEAVQVRWLSGDQFTPTPVPGQYTEGRAVLGQQQSIVLTVHAPKAAAAGVYTGRLGVACEGFTGDLPVTVEVMPWVAPPPKDRHMLTGLIHSPDTIALQYKVEPWSDAHLKFMEPSLRLLNDLGSESCQVFLIAEGIINERYSMVRRRADGSPDFTCMDRYLDLWQKVCGQPKKLTLYLWDFNNNKSPEQQWSATNSVKVTQIKADGSLVNIRAPYYGTPGSKAFWQPVFDGIRERLAKRGWKDTEVLLGVPGDQLNPSGNRSKDRQPQKEAVTFLQEVAPGWRWRMFVTAGSGQGLPDANGKLVLKNGLEVGWLEGNRPISIIAYAPFAGGPGTDIVRGATMKRSYPLTVGTADAVLSVGLGAQGLSQVGVDFWQLPEGDKEGWSPTLMRGGGREWWNVNPNVDVAKSLTTPGPNGAEPAGSYEWLREGMQIAEAFIQVRDHDSRLPEEIRFQATEATETLNAFLLRRMLAGDFCNPTSPIQRQSAVRALYRVAGELQSTALLQASLTEKPKSAVGGSFQLLPVDMESYA
ncbi:MAG: glycoside hydrolase domain-containing protein, partial [Thermoguttaceae bacterium]